MFPDLPVYEIGTNQYLIDDRSVDYAALAAQQQAVAEAEGLTNPAIIASKINTNGLWLEVPTDSLADANGFKVILHNTIQGTNYDFLTKSDLLYPTWATKLTAVAAVGNATEVELPMNAHPILFVRARVSTASYSFYINTPPLSQYVEDGDMVTFSVTTGGNTNLTYQWTFNCVPIEGATNRSYTINSVQDSDWGAYAVIISDGTNSLVTPAAQLTTDLECSLGTSHTGDIILIPVLGMRQDYTFRSGITYYINSPIALYGNTTIEAGAVLKFNSYNGITYPSLIIKGGLTCKGEPYNPSILTSINDDAVGAWIHSSSGQPQPAATGSPFLDLYYAQSNSISNLRVCFADWGVTIPNASRKLDVWDCQFVRCNYGIVNLVDGSGAKDSLHNVLFAACGMGTAVGAWSPSVTIEGEQVTADVGDFCQADYTPSRIALTNSIIRENSLSASNLSTNHVAFNPNSTNFVSEGYGHYYLAAKSPLHSAGTTNISSRLKTEFQNKTTSSPVPIAAFTQITGNMTLSPQAPRYTNGAPDLGYYYDALDYTVANLTLSGGNITVLPGTAIAVRNEYIPNCYYASNGGSYGDCNYTVEGFVMQQGSSFVSHGTPTKPNIFTAEKMVQEFPETVWSSYQYYTFEWWFGAITFVPDFELGDAVAPTLDFRFSKFYLPPNDYHIWAGMAESWHYEGGSLEWSPDSSMYLSLQDCSVHGGRINLGTPDFYYHDPGQVYAPGAVTWVNNSFENVSINLDPTYNEYEWGNGVNCDMRVQAYNNLFRGGLWLHLEPIPASAGNWVFKDNLFDRVNFVQDATQTLDCDNNGYWPLSSSDLLWDWDYPDYYPFSILGFLCPWWWMENSGQLQPTTTGEGAHEVVLGNAPPYQSGSLGNFYLPTNTPLYGAGSTNAAGPGLYQYTTRVDQMKEGDDTAKANVNIGLHYVAANGNGQPLDSDSDGIPDYVEDANGNGLVDWNPVVGANETDWQNAMTDGYADATNSAYDDIDLSGDGLVGRVKKALGMNPFDTSNPLTLKQVTTGQEPDIATFEVPISYNLLTNIGGLHLFVGGVDATLEDCVPATNGHCLLEWNTDYEPPGQRYMQAMLTLNQFFDENVQHIGVGMGTIKAFSSTNVAQFYEGHSRFDSGGAVLYARTPACSNASYTIELRNPDNPLSPHIKTITGSTSTGVISEYWDLKDDNTNVYTGNKVDAVFNVTLLDLGSATQTQRLNLWSYPGDGNFDVAYAYDCFTGFLNVDGAFWNQMQGVVDVLTDPIFALDVYYSNFDVFWYNFYGYPGYILDQKTATNLVNDLANPATENFYFYGHGYYTDGSGITDGLLDAAGIDGLNVAIHSKWVADALTNHVDVKGNINFKHPYRFVFLDTCSSAKYADWQHAFGIVDGPPGPGPWTDPDPPRAFLGWEGDKYGMNGVWADDTYCNDYGTTINLFYDMWMSGATLDECIRACSVNYVASNYNVANPSGLRMPFPVPGNEHCLLSDGRHYDRTGGCPHLKLVGYRGLTRSGYDPSYPTGVTEY
jgi:hypothetical protein